MAPSKLFDKSLNPSLGKSFSPLVLSLLLALAGTAAQAAEIEAPWVRPTAPGAKVGGAFMTLVGGKQADRLISASSPAAAVVELHTHLMEDGVAKMRAIPVIEVPAGGKVELKPGGLHIMLINLKAPLVAGENVSLKLRFEKAGEIEIRVPVSARSPSGEGPPPHHAGHGGN